MVYNTYIPLNDTKISFWYLKANNMEEALKLFSETSFLNKKLILTDYQLMSNDNLFVNTFNDNNNLSITKQELERLFI